MRRKNSDVPIVCRRKDRCEGLAICVLVPPVSMLVSMQHVRVSEQVSGDSLLLINAHFMAVMLLSH